MTYAELSTAIQDHSEYSYDSTFVANIPLFVKQTEQQVWNKFYLVAYRKVTTSLVTTDGNRSITLPDDLLEIALFGTVTANLATWMTERDVSFIKEYWPNQLTEGIPKYFALEAASGAANSIKAILAPTPNAALATELDYYFRPESCVSAAGGSWLSDNFDGVLLYGSLYHGAIYMKEGDMLAVYRARFDEAMSELGRHGEIRARSTAYQLGEGKAS